MKKKCNDGPKLQFQLNKTNKINYTNKIFVKIMLRVYFDQ